MTKAEITKLRKKKLLEQLEKYRGVISYAVKAVGCPRQTHYEYYHKDPEYRQAFDNILESVIDNVEKKLLDCIDAGMERSIHFFLKSKAKNRGYETSLDITSNGESIVWNETKTYKNEDKDKDDIK